MDKICYYAFILFTVTISIWLVFDQFSILETPITPANHWIPEVFTAYFIGIVYAVYLPKIVRDMAFIGVAGWGIYTISFFPLLGILITIPLSFIILLLGVFYLGYRKGVEMVWDKPIYPT